MNTYSSLPLDLDALRLDFPVLNQRVNGHDLVYFDNAATTQSSAGCDDPLL
jgi:cysteine desulfurase/selenocysteine lyase